MNIETFAHMHGLRIKRDECGDPVITSKVGHIYEHGALVFGVILLESPRYSNRLLLAGRCRLAQLGLELHQAGDFESIFV